MDNNQHINSQIKNLSYWIDSQTSLIEHNATIGSNVELIVREIIKSYLPDKFGVETGFVKSLNNLDWISAQIDIILTHKNQGFPLVTSLSSKVFPLEAVLGIIEVTKTLSKKKIEEDFKKISSLMKMKTRKNLLTGTNAVTFLEASLNSDISDEEKKRCDELLHNINNKTNPRNVRVDYLYNDMQPRFYYFAVDSNVKNATLLKHIKRYSDENSIIIHGLYVLKRGLFVNNLCSEISYVENKETSFISFIHGIIDGLITYGDLPGIIPFNEYFQIDKSSFKKY